MHCIVNANVARLLWPAPFLLSRGQEVGTEGADVVGGYSVERRWRREERRRSGEFPPLVISLFLLLGHTLTESKTSGESETERVCACVTEEEDLTERVHTYSSTWQRTVLLHPWIIPICGCQVCVQSICAVARLVFSELYWNAGTKFVVIRPRRSA